MTRLITSTIVKGKKNFLSFFPDSATFVHTIFSVNNPWYPVRLFTNRISIRAIHVLP
jgi:hypothetical protein